MSYCRWSSDDFRCDVYVYHDVGGWWQIFVAEKRVDYREPLPDTVPVPVGYPPEHENWVKFWERCDKVSKMREKAGMVNIGGEYDAESIRCASPGECAGWLVRIMEAGYCVPEYAIKALQEEQREIDMGLSAE